MEHSADLSKGEHYQWEAFGPHRAVDRKAAREALWRLQKQHTIMREPRTRGARKEILQILAQAIPDFPRFVRDGYDQDADAALDALYVAYIRLRNNMAKMALAKKRKVPSSNRPTRRTRRRRSSSSSSPETESSFSPGESSGTESAEPTTTEDDEPVSSCHPRASSPTAPAADPSPPTPAGRNSIPSVIIQVRRAGSHEIVGETLPRLLVALEAPLADNEPIPPEYISFQKWMQFLEKECDYQEEIDDICPLDPNGQPLAPVRTPNRLRFLLLQATGHTLVFEIAARCSTKERRRSSRNQW